MRSGSAAAAAGLVFYTQLIDFGLLHHALLGNMTYNYLQLPWVQKIYLIICNN